MNTNMDHTSHTAAEIEAQLAELRAEQSDLSREHGKHVLTHYPPGTLGAGQISGSYTIDNTTALRRIALTISALEYELECAHALEKSGFNHGDRVRVGPPFIGRYADGSERFGHDDITDRLGTVRGITGDGHDLRIVFDDGRTQNRYDFAPITRCTKVEVAP